MNLLWLGPLVTLGFMAGFTTSAVLLRLGRLSHPVARIAALGLPFAGAALPIVLLFAISLLGIGFAPGSSSPGF